MLSTYPQAPAIKACIEFDNIHASDPRILSGYTSKELGDLFAQYLIVLQYQTGDLSLGEVAEILGHYPDIQKTKEWLNAHGAVQLYSPSERAHLQLSLSSVVADLGVADYFK